MLKALSQQLLVLHLFVQFLSKLLRAEIFLELDEV